VGGLRALKWQNTRHGGAEGSGWGWRPPKVEERRKRRRRVATGRVRVAR